MSNGDNGYRSNNQGYQNQNRGFQQYDQQYGSKRDQSKNGESLRPVNFDNAAAFRKDFYNPSDIARARSIEEVKGLNAKYEISLVGRDSNKYPPIAYFSEAGFPDYIMNEITRQGFTAPTGIQVGSEQMCTINNTNCNYCSFQGRWIANSHVGKKFGWNCKDWFWKNAGIHHSGFNSFEASTACAIW